MIYGKYGRGKGERRKSQRTLIPPDRLRRLPAEIRIGRGEDNRVVVVGRVFLHDLTPAGIGLFVENKLERGEYVEITISGPKILYLMGTVAWCAESRITYRVLREQSFPYRIGVKLQFDDPADMLHVQAFCDELAIRSDGRMTYSEQAEKRRVLLRKAMIAICQGDSPGAMESCLALRPTAEEIFAVATEVKAQDPAFKWSQRVQEVETTLCQRLGLRLRK